MELALMAHIDGVQLRLWRHAPWQRQCFLLW